MTGREWRPGDVAMLTITERANGRRHNSPSVGIRDNVGSWASGAAMARQVNDVDVLAARPLVVIDPSDREQMERLLDAHNEAEKDAACKGRECGSGSCWIDIMAAALREFANPTPPKPEEPTGLGAVVEDADGVRWTHVECSAIEVLTRNPWYPANSADEQPREWHDIRAVRILSEGVPA